jgi:hypothetical protein
MYLGFTIGPNKGDRFWTGAVDKATNRVGEWDWAPLGLFFATKVWNTFVASLFGFVAQLAGLLRRAGHGPGNGCSDGDLMHLRRLLRGVQGHHDHGPSSDAPDSGHGGHG